MTDAQPIEWRQAPHNIEAEQALLGAMLVDPEAYERVADFLEPAHFFDPLHRELFETMGALITSGKRVTGHGQNLFQQCQADRRRHHSGGVSRHACRQRHHRHQCP